MINFVGRTLSCEEEWNELKTSYEMNQKEKAEWL